MLVFWSVNLLSVFSCFKFKRHMYTRSIGPQSTEVLLIMKNFRQIATQVEMQDLDSVTYMLKS